MLFLILCPLAQAALVQWYPMDEGATEPATNLIYSAVSTNRGILDGSSLPMWFSTGLAPVPAPGTRAALYFNGASATAPKPNITTDFPGVAGTRARTVSTWIKPDAVQGANPTIVHWGPGTPNGARFTFKLNPNSAGAGGWQIRLEIQGGGINGTKNVADGQWHHVAVVSVDAGTVGTAQLYVDGVRDPVSSSSGTGTAINTAANYYVAIGNAMGWDNTRGFSGAIDEVRIYDEALPASEILALAYGDGNPPSLTSPLLDQSIVLGDTSASATFSPAIGGTAPLGFQWTFYGTNLPFETNATLVINPASPAHVGPYSLTVSNVFGTTNASASLLLNTAPIEPSQQTALVGASATFSLGMPGTSTGYTYQWRKDGAEIEGATGSSYTISRAAATDESGNYTVIVTLAGVCATSAPPARLRVINAPASAYAGLVLGDGPAGYWRLGETNGAVVAVDESELNPGVYSNYFGTELGAPGALINDADTASSFGPNQNFVQVPYQTELSRTNALTLEAWVNPAGTGGKQSLLSCYGNVPVVGYELYIGDSGNCVFRTSCNTASTGETWDTLDGGPLPPGVWTHLAAVLEEGTKRLYTNGVLAASQGAQMIAAKGIPIRIGAGTPGGAPSAFFYGLMDEPAIYGKALTTAQICNHYLAGVYADGTPPSILTEPQLQRVVLGDTNVTALFAVGAVGSAPLFYQWRRDGLDLAGQTDGMLAIPSAGISGPALYSVLVTNRAGSLPSSSAALAYTTAAVSPANPAVLVGGSASLSVAMPAYQAYTYQWKHAGTNVAGATASACLLPNVGTADGGPYTVAVNLGADWVESEPVNLTVIPSPIQSYSEEVSADAPVAWWRLNEPAGSLIAAEVSGCYPGVIYSDVKLGLEGALLGEADTSAGFTGYSLGGRAGQSRIDVSYAPNLNGSVFSLECWALVSGGAGTYRSPITSRESSSGYCAGYLFYAGDNDLWQFWLGTGGSFLQSSGPAVMEEQWTHLVGTCDGANAAFYVNGSLVFSGPVAYVPNSANRLCLGAGATENPNGNFFFPGRIDEVAIYTNVLSAARVQAHYAAAFPATAVPRFTRQPLTRATLAGENYTLSAMVHSAAPLNLQWQHNGTNVPGATQSTLRLSPVSPLEAGTYQLVATHDGESASSAPASLQVLAGEAVSVSFEGFEGYRTIEADGGYAGYVALTNWNEIAYNSSSGSITNLIDNRGQTNVMTLTWSAFTGRRWNGPFTVAKADAALLNGFLEAGATNPITVTLANIPARYQNAGYSLYAYLGAPSAAAGIVNPYDWFGAASLGVVTNYYQAMDLVNWDGSFQVAATIDPLEPNPAPANCVVFTNLNSSSVTLTLAPHPYLSGPASVSGLQLVANAISPVALTIARSGNGIILSWPGDWVLQQSSVLNGSPNDWTDVAGATSPYTAPMSSTGQQYYRLRSP